MADFEWSWPKQIDRPLIERALTLDFLADGRNLVLVGGNGLGKTMISKNIGHAAVLAGHSALHITAAQLIDHLQCDSPELRRRRLAKYLGPRLLCLDEVGYLSFDDHAADLLYRVLDPRCEQRRSTLVTTNLAFKQWNTVFPNATCITTIVDRLTHHADVTRILGDSYRAHESEREAAVRRKERAASSARSAPPPKRA
jgi:DNA replication protein DnaC